MIPENEVFKNGKVWRSTGARARRFKIHVEINV